MLPLLFDRLRIVVSPERISWLRSARGKVLETGTLGLPSSRPIWKSALDALPEVLTRQPGKVWTTVILSDRFVRYTVVPWNDVLVNKLEQETFARHCFSRTYDDMGEWDLRLDRGHFGESHIASAVDRSLLAAVREAFLHSSKRLWSIQPHFMAAFNLSRKHIGKGNNLFLVVEGRRLICAALRDGCWLSIHSDVFDDLRSELSSVIEREQLWAGWEVRPAVFLYAPEYPNLEIPLGEPVTLLPSGTAISLLPIAVAET